MNLRKYINKILRSPHVVVAKGYLGSEFANYPPKCNGNDPTCYHHLAWMLTEIAKNEMSPTKANRWLGYVQGVMVGDGLLDVNQERERTRPIFKGM
ncbi:conserved hypothetical protein [Vibrio chagasii]|nr:conserved hypothetical protein [Vibrio chagasii]